MVNKSIRITSLMVVATLVVSTFIGCGKSNKKAQDNTPAPSSQASSFSYPMKTDATLKYWVDLNPNVSANFKNLGDTVFAQELQKRTGIKVEFQHPAAGQAKDAFNLMIASGDLPDIIEYNWVPNFAGGPELAISNNIIMKLNDNMSKFAPNLKKYLDANPEINKAVKTDSGSYYGFPFVRGDELLLTSYGPVIRKDWLKDLGQEAPVTIDDWYNTLKAFKEKKNATAPLNISFSDFTRGIVVGAWGINKNFYVDNGKVKFGPADPAYKDFLSTIAKWYKEGLLDKNFATNDGKAMDANVTSEKSGITITYSGSGISKFLPAVKEKNPNADLGPAAFPVLKKGDKPQISSRENNVNGLFAAISANTKNAEAAMRLLDYAYSDEGNLLYNFGVQDKTYKMVNGYPTMQDEVMKNPDKLTIAQAWAKYARGNYNGPFVQRKEYTEQYNALQQQKDAIVLWSNTDASKHVMPNVTPTKDESAQYSKIINDVNTYVDEFSLKVILGTESIDNFSKYTEQLKKFNVDKAIEIQQAGYDRYNKR